MGGGGCEVSRRTVACAHTYRQYRRPVARACDQERGRRERGWLAVRFGQLSRISRVPPRRATIAHPRARRRAVSRTATTRPAATRACVAELNPNPAARRRDGRKYHRADARRTTPTSHECDACRDDHDRRDQTPPPRPRPRPRPHRRPTRRRPHHHGAATARRTHVQGEDDELVEVDDVDRHHDDDEEDDGRRAGELERARVRQARQLVGDRLVPAGGVGRTHAARGRPERAGG